MIFREGEGRISIGDRFACPLAIFQRCEPEYIPIPIAWHRIWSDHVHCLTNGHTQQGDPFYTPERFAHYCSRISIYQRALEAANYAASDADDLIDAGDFTTLFIFIEEEV